MVAVRCSIHRVSRFEGGMMSNQLQFCRVVLALFSIPTIAHSDEKKMEPFTDRVKGTLVRFEMLPIKGGKFIFSPDGKEPAQEVEIKSFFMSKTETTWDQ